MQAESLTFSRNLIDYLDLAKPCIVLLVLFTTLAGFRLAAGGNPSFELLTFTLLGTGLAAGSAGTLNNIIDRRLDAPLVFITLRRALSGDFQRHRRIARITLPLWLYVALSGWLVYWMLYHLRL
jgi:heme O synthase-like polyprenyltransferase